MRRLVSPGYLSLGLLAIVALSDVMYGLQTSGTGKFAPDALFDAVTSATEARVSIVRSDDPALPSPASVAGDLNDRQIEAMVRRAVDLIGGFEWLVRPGDRVLIKPNIVDPEPPGVGEITDVRVVKAIARIVHEVTGGDVEVIVGEGSPRPMAWELPYAPSWNAPAWTELWDVAGFQTLLTDPELADVNLRLTNLNGPWEDLVEVDIPQGGYFDRNLGRLWVHKDVLNADVLINVPVMKIHNTGITVALKNSIGLYPATKYGFSRSVGVPQDDFKHRLLHYDDAPRDWVEEQVVDINLVADVDFTIVDALMTLQQSKNAMRSGTTITNQIRRNMILASADPVAIDHVAARLMGQNPDDIAMITLAERVGLGTNNRDQIDVFGAPVEPNIQQYIKDPLYTSDFGQGNRTWLLAGPFPAAEVDAPLDHAFLADEAALIGQPGRDGWSEPIYFFDDRIDLGAFYNVGVGARTVAYAFTWFDAPADQQAELWIGSDEGLRVWINGEIAYDYTRRRTYRDDEIVQDKKLPIRLRKGENTLLVKAVQEFSDFQFALNICEPEANFTIDGDRVDGLKFRAVPLAMTAVTDERTTPAQFALDRNYPNPFNAATVIPFHVDGMAGRDRRVTLEILDVTGQRVRSLVDRALAPGPHSRVWDGTDDAGRAVASGVFLTCLRVDDGTASRKLVLLR
ncbi:MAG: DUF362 domain-containing protein [bacterium]|nr:DUF362 domain-containing protein [bacterium]